MKKMVSISVAENAKRVSFALFVFNEFITNLSNILIVFYIFNGMEKCCEGTTLKFF